MRIAGLAMLTLVSACATHVATPNIALIVNAERAFADDVAARGQRTGFLASLAPDAFVMSPEPYSAFQAISEQAEAPTPAQWRPSYAGIARSGDFGFSTGPAYPTGSETVPGNYFTVWRLQPDGSWKWIYDGGVGVIDDSRPGDDISVREAPIASGGAGSASAALAEVNAIELNLARQAADDAVAGLAAHYADDAVVKRRRQRAGTTREAFAALAAVPATRIEFDQVRAEASAAGDMVFSLGYARWNGETGAQQNGVYARIWQWRPEGWRIIYDQLSQRPPVPPPS